MVAYNKQQWRDEIPDLTKPIKDASGKQKTDPQTGRPLYELVQEGTRITSQRLNHIEDGIETVHELADQNAADIDTHKKDTVKHITAAERAEWKAKETPAGAQTKADAALSAAKTYADTALLAKADKSSTYSKTETDQRIQAVVGAAPDALDTLKEIGDALNNDPNFAATVTNQLSGKVDKVSGKQLSTEDYSSAEKAKLAGLTPGAGGGGSSTDTVIGNRTIVDTEAPTSDTGAPTKLWGWLAYMLKSITGENNWRTVPGMTIKAIKGILDNAVSAATANAIIKRDASGRAQVTAPAAGADIARKDTVDDAIVTAVADATYKVNTALASAKTYTETGLLSKADKSSTYTKSETDQRIQAVVGAAPDALDTLKEIGDALNNDPNFAATVTNQISGKVDKVSGKELSSNDYTTAEKTKLAGVAAGANNYTHPASHPASIITQDANNRFTTDAEKAAWNAKAGTAVATTTSNGLMSAADKTLLNNNTGFGTTAGTATAYTVTLSSAPTALVAGLRFSFKSHIASGANPTLNPNALGAKVIKKPNGNVATLALNGVYTVLYDGTAFILQGEGGEYGTATAAEVLLGKTIGTENGLVTGTLIVKPKESSTTVISSSNVMPFTKFDGTSINFNYITLDIGSLGFVPKTIAANHARYEVVSVIWNKEDIVVGFDDQSADCFFVRNPQDNTLPQYFKIGGIGSLTEFKLPVGISGAYFTVTFYE